MDSSRRRLAALMFTDVADYSRHTHANEERTLKLLAEQCEVIRTIFPAYGGREVKTVDDDLLGVVTFADKQGNAPFTNDDFQLARILSKDLALLVAHFRFRQQLESYVGVPGAGGSAA